MPVVDPKDLTSLSVQERALEEFRTNAPITWRIASMADDMPAYGSPERDIALDKFWKTEPILAGAIYSMAAKIAALDFRLKGPRRLVKKYKQLLMAADFGIGNGWVNFVFKVAQDMLTQDNGAFIELLRNDGASPYTAVQGVAHIDSQRCTRTGNPMVPVQYQPYTKPVRQLQWYEVIAMSDMPSPREEMYNRGLCAVSRVLRAAQTMRDISVYNRQKLAGKRTPAIAWVNGISRDYVKACIDKAIEDQLSQGDTLYSGPIIIASMDASVPVHAELMELAGLPDNYSEDTALKWYIATLALDFGTDYTEFSPLPGGNLGSATQATEMAARARGKGPGAMLQQFEFAFNYWVLPESCEFQFASTDATAEQQRITQRRERAQERAIRIQSTEITPLQALELAVADGDAPDSFLAPGEDTVDSRIDAVLKELGGVHSKLANVQDRLSSQVEE